LIKYILTAFISGLFLVSAVNAKENTGIDNVVDQIQKKYEKINEFHATFVQEAEVRSLDTVEKANGEVWFKKPGMMRWNYYKPTKDEIVSDGKTIWYYNEQEKQVMRSSLAKLNQDSNSTTLLTGLGKIKELFNARFSSEDGIENSPESYLIELTPKDNNSDKNSDNNNAYNKIIISVDKNNTLVNTIYLFDPFGNKTKITLNDLKLNDKIKDSVFNFKAPKGTEVVDMPSSGQ